MWSLRNDQWPQLKQLDHQLRPPTLSGPELAAAQGLRSANPSEFKHLRTLSNLIFTTCVIINIHSLTHMSLLAEVRFRLLYMMNTMQTKVGRAQDIKK